MIGRLYLLYMIPRSSRPLSCCSLSLPVWHPALINPPNHDNNKKANIFTGQWRIDLTYINYNRIYWRGFFKETGSRCIAPLWDVLLCFIDPLVGPSRYARLRYTLICYFSSSFVSFHAAMLVAVIMCLELLYEIFFKIIFYLKIYIKIIFLFIFKINILKLFKNTKKNQLDAFHVKCIFRKHQKKQFQIPFKKLLYSLTRAKLWRVF